jgi:hypothetical protein
MVSPVTLPAIEGWPYEQVAAAFELCKAETPSVLMVGFSLWSLLWKTVDADEFYVCDVIPIRLDRTGILEPHEFMFTRE